MGLPDDEGAILMQIETVAVERLIPYARNSRTHSEAQVAQIAASIREFGFTNPVLIDAEGGIIAGHGRVMGARQLALAEVPCIRLGHLTEAQRRAYVIADNKLAANAGWDEEMLGLELRDLMAGGYDVGLTGFTMGEVDDLLEGLDTVKTGNTDPDAVPPVKPPPITQPGDVWLLGKHRLMCGDSTLRDDVGKLMRGRSAAVCLTDPPYGLDGHETAKNDYDKFNDTKENVSDMASKWLPIAREMASAVVFSCGVTRQWIYPEPDWVLCWFYGAGQARSKWGFNCWQPFLAYGADPSLKSGNGCRPDAVNSNTPANGADLDHPCPKPVELWLWMVYRLSFKRGDIFYEPFSGSGTTIIACEQTGRRCYAMELSPQYVDVAVRRWQQFTGKRATLEATGAEFPG